MSKCFAWPGCARVFLEAEPGVILAGLFTADFVTSSTSKEVAGFGILRVLFHP